MRRQLRQGSAKKLGQSLLRSSGYACDALERRVLLSALNLDPSFNGTGKVITDINGGDDKATAVAIQADGKTVVAGYSTVNGVSHVSLVRYNTDGSLDSGLPGDLNIADHFGTAGRVIANFSSAGDGDSAWAICIQSDQKILIGGTADTSNLGTHDFLLARYTTAGLLDTSFAGGAGFLTYNIGLVVQNQILFTDDYVHAMALQPDGKIVLAGSTNSNLAIARFNSNGTLDSSFGTGGRLQTQLSSAASITAIAIQGDGDIVAAGTAVLSAHISQIALARYLPNGALDASFSADGELTTSYTDPHYDQTFSLAAQGVVVQPDGKIVVAGGIDAGFLDEGENVVLGTIAVVRYNVDGTLDSTFQGGAFLEDPAPMPGFDFFQIHPDFEDEFDSYSFALALQRNGTIDVAGAGVDKLSSDNFIYNIAGVAQVTTNGVTAETEKIDFNGLTGDAEADSYASAIAVTSNGNIVLAVTASNGGGGDNFALARLVGTPTAAFASISGSVFTDTDGNGAKATSEPFRIDARVYIDADNSGTYNTVSGVNEQSCLTDLNGNYKLDGLAAGTYKVRVVVPGTYTQTVPASGAGYTITVTAGQNVGSKTFGLKPPSTHGASGQIDGNVFNDLNANGARDIDDPLNPTDTDIVGCTVYLDLNQDGVDDGGEPTTLTDAAGDFQISPLVAGTYKLRVVPPNPTWLATTPISYNVTLSGGQEVDEAFGMVQLTGTAAGATDDTIIVRRDPVDSTLLEVLVNNQITFDSSYALLNSIVIDSGTGTDAIDLQDIPAGLPTQAMEEGNGTVLIGNAGNMQDILSQVTASNVTGSTSLTLDDSADATGRTVTVNNYSVNGLSPGEIDYVDSNGVPGTGVRGLTVNTGAGADLVNIPVLDPAVVLSLNTGDGNDTVNVGAGPNQFSTFNISSLHFDGGTGNDALVFDDQSGTQSTLWAVSTGTVSETVAGLGPSASDLFFESITINCCDIGSSFHVTATLAPMAVTLNEGAGNDTNTLANGTGKVTFITSLVTINGNGGSNTLTVDDSGVVSPAKVHVTPTQIGAAVGDSLFGTGGSVNYAGISTLTVSTPGASAGDTIFVRPSAATAITINGGNPTTSPGDTMTLADADATNPHLTPNGTGAGQYTFSNRQPVTFRGIEQSSQDAIAPSVVNPSLQFTTLPQSMIVPFSENLAGTPPLSSFFADLGSPAYPMSFTGLSFAGNVATVNFAGTLADGNYNGYVFNAGITDVAGNPMAGDVSFSFFILAGDANHDRVVDTMDFTMLAQNFGAVNVGASQGDFNYDGRVNALDFNVLATQFGTHLLPAGSSPVADSVVSGSPVSELPHFDLFNDAPIKSASLLDVLNAAAR